jgi:hypothetical protein
MRGRMKFGKPSTDPRATVVNQGSITVAKRGLAALVAPGVENSGVIQAKLGKVVLGGAETFTVDFYGDGLISFDVGSKVTAVPVGPDGQPLKSLVSNTGRINAPAGTVLLTADAAAGIRKKLRSLVSNTGRINAPGGTVILTVDAAAGIIQYVVGVPDQMARGTGQTRGLVTIDAGLGSQAARTIEGQSGELSQTRR